MEIVGSTVRVALSEFNGSFIAFGDKLSGSYPACTKTFPLIGSGLVNPDRVKVVVAEPVIVIPLVVPSVKAVVPVYHWCVTVPVLVSLSVCDAGNVAVAIPMKVAIPDATLQEVPTG